MSDLIDNKVRKFTKKIGYAMAELLILKTVDTNPTHGYKIMLILRRKLGFILSPSTVYTLLSSLLCDGYISSEKAVINNHNINLFTLTHKGKRLLDQYQQKHKVLVFSLQD